MGGMFGSGDAKIDSSYNPTGNSFQLPPGTISAGGKSMGGGMPPKTRLQDIAQPGLDNAASGFQGGLRPAPRNYRPPVRSGGILRRRMR
jgi:hypothetical protein